MTHRSSNTLTEPENPYDKFGFILFLCCLFKNSADKENFRPQKQKCKEYGIVGQVMIW